MKSFLFLLFLLLWRFDAFAADDGGWRKIYTQVPEAYVYNVTPEELAVAALKSLHRVDKNLTVGNDKTRLTLYYKGKVVKVLRKPEDRQDAASWAELSTMMSLAAAEYSPIAGQRDFELPDIMAAGMVRVLDKDSKFYGDMDKALGISSVNKRTFAARRDGNDLYIKITAFNKQTLAEVKKALEENAAAAALVLDLRGCPGGMLGEAIKMADLFLDGGIIASTRGKQPEEVYYTADAGDMWRGKEITILVDKQTASAAEVLAAALQEQGRAEIAGEKTQGKGSIQKLLPLPSGSVLAITNGFFMAPSGRELNGKGIFPDKKVPEFYEN